MNTRETFSLFHTHRIQGTIIGGHIDVTFSTVEFFTDKAAHDDGQEPVIVITRNDLTGAYAVTPNLAPCGTLHSSHVQAVARVWSADAVSVDATGNALEFDSANIDASKNGILIYSGMSAYSL